MSRVSSKNKPTVLFVFHNSDYYSGATRSLLDIIDNYIEKKTINIVALFPKNGTAVDYLVEKGIPVYFCFYTELVANINQHWVKKIIAFPYRLVRLLYSSYCIYKLKGVLKNNKIDIVYTNTSVIFVGGLINKFFNIPHIWHFREFRKEDQNIDFFFGEKLFFRFAKKYSNKIIVISKSMYQKHVINIPKEKLKIIYNDISPKYINPKKCFNLENQKLELLISGTLSEGKGQLDVLKALKILINKGYDLTLNIAGNTECNYFKVLSKFVKDNKLENNVVFHGLVKNMNKLRDKMDIGIVASKCEAFGRVTIEGMLSSLAMIGSNSAGTSELIEDNFTGLLYKTGNVEELASKIEYLYLNRAEIKRLGQNGFKYAMEKFTTGKCSDSILEIIKEMIIKKDIKT